MMLRRLNKRPLIFSKHVMRQQRTVMKWLSKVFFFMSVVCLLLALIEVKLYPDPLSYAYVACETLFFASAGLFILQSFLKKVSYR